MNERIESLRRALNSSPDDATLRLMLAEELARIDHRDEALQEYERLLRNRNLSGDAALQAGHLAVDAGRVDLAKGFAEGARAAGVVEGLATLEAAIQGILEERGVPKVHATVDPEEPEIPWAKEIVKTTFDQVGGLDDIKKAIHRMIILPLARPELYERYGRKSGGGILLYGPPGCGKTLLARATAGECNLPFVNVRIEEVLDPFFGMSERNLHSAFEFARASAPCVLFLDELDALGYARSKQRTDSARNLADLLLQEMDSIGSENEQILVLAATNAPWDVDEALLRPGRFDRRIFVPPPDEQGRRAILELLLSRVPNKSIETRGLAREMALFSGADIRGLIESAVDKVIDEALEGNGEPPLEPRHIEASVAGIQPTTVEWLRRAKNYVEFANQGGRYTDIESYLKRRDVKRMIGI
jgi:SpoVK/Ycf46/Vps4 family AAA+-type ATPase